MPLESDKVELSQRPKSTSTKGLRSASRCGWIGSRSGSRRSKWSAVWARTLGDHQAHPQCVLPSASWTRFALASASDEARGSREEVGFFQAIRAALVKSATAFGASRLERELAIQQIVSRAVVSTEIVDILAAADIKSRDIPSSQTSSWSKCSRWGRRTWRWKPCASCSMTAFAPEPRPT
jgi:hypothetical protein